MEKLINEFKAQKSVDLTDLFISAVYGLNDDKGELLYIGSTDSLLNRIVYHTKKIEFKSFVFLPCEVCELINLETLLISTLKPTLNKMLPNNNDFFIGFDAIRLNFFDKKQSSTSRFLTKNNLQPVLHMGRICYYDKPSVLKSLDNWEE